METKEATKKNNDEQVKEWWSKFNCKTPSLFFEALLNANVKAYHNIGKGEYKIIKLDCETLFARIGKEYFIFYPVTSEYIKILFPFDEHAVNQILESRKNYDEQVREWWSKFNCKTPSLFFEALLNANVQAYHNFGRGTYKIIELETTLFARIGKEYFIFYPVTSEYIKILFPFDELVVNEI